MTEREVRISPDGDSIAIKSDNAEGSWNEWACMNSINGGYWAKGNQVETWNIVTATEAPPEPPAPENPVGPMGPLVSGYTPPPGYRLVPDETPAEEPPVVETPVEEPPE